MSDDPIVVWPPGTDFQSCSNYGWFDCTWEFQVLQAQGYTACCVY